MKPLAFALLIGLAGCVGSLEPLDPGPGTGSGAPDGGTQSPARQMFESTVSPLLSASCAGCHEGTATTPPPFLGSTGATGFYTSLTANSTIVGNFNPANALLLTHGVHDNGAGPAWTTAQASTISSWLSAEATARGL